jgi:hypothetical protein
MKRSAAASAASPQLLWRLFDRLTTVDNELRVVA